MLKTLLSLIGFFAGVLALQATTPLTVWTPRTALTRDDVSSRDEVLYLPRADAVHAVSFSYRNAVSQLLWFRTISYFGKHFRTDRSYEWLSSMCQLVTGLNPRMDHAFRFCATMLAWEASRPTDAQSLLTIAISINPDDWELLYQRGFNSLYFLKDERSAHNDFVRAAQLPGAHALVKTLAAKSLAKLDTPETAIQFLTQQLRGTNDSNQRKALLERLAEVRFQSLAQQISLICKRYRDELGKLPSALDELQQIGAVRSDLEDPFGGALSLEADCRLSSTHLPRRLRNGAKEGR